MSKEVAEYIFFRRSGESHEYIHSDLVHALIREAEDYIKRVHESKGFPTDCTKLEASITKIKGV